LQIYPQVKQLWPPEGDSRVTNMDVVFFSDLEGFDLEDFDLEEFDLEGATPLEKPGETWLQKGHPEVCWPQQWLPEDLGSNVRIFEIRPGYISRALDRYVEKMALLKLQYVAREW